MAKKGSWVSREVLLTIGFVVLFVIFAYIMLRFLTGAGSNLAIK